MAVDPLAGSIVLKTQIHPAQNNTVKPLSDTERQRAKLKKATQEFEGVFIGMMLKQMRKSMAGNTPLFGSSYEAKYYQEMVDDKVAQQMSSTGSFGLATKLYKSMEHTLGLDKRELPNAPTFDAGVEQLVDIFKKMQSDMNGQKIPDGVSGSKTGK